MAAESVGRDVFHLLGFVGRVRGKSCRQQQGRNDAQIGTAGVHVASAGNGSWILESYVAIIALVLGIVDSEGLQAPVLDRIASSH